MSDIVERLNAAWSAAHNLKKHANVPPYLVSEAVVEIERLRAERDSLSALSTYHNERANRAEAELDALRGLLREGDSLIENGAAPRYFHEWQNRIRAALGTADPTPAATDPPPSPILPGTPQA